MTLSAFFRFSFLITTEIFSSDEPWAVAITLIPFRPSDLKSVADIPGVFFILSPTMAIIDRSFSTSILSSFLNAISLSNSWFIPSTAFLVSGGVTAKVIEYSEDACVIRIIFTLRLAREPKSLIEVPDMPTIDGP